MYVPEFLRVAPKFWAVDEYGHEPIVLGVALWLIWRAHREFFAVPDKPAPLAGVVTLAIGILLYAIGRSQSLRQLDIASQIPVLAGIALLIRGWRGLKVVWFPIFFLIFMVPLPQAIVQPLTVTLKSLVSQTVELLLYQAGYPIARSGVVLSIGQYKLFVADACAGIASLFSLEALGMLYMNLMRYRSVARNLTLAALIMPISFVANVIRVTVLVLVTYHGGEALLNGPLHGGAGMVLFIAGLILMLIVDSLLNWFFPRERVGPSDERGEFTSAPTGASSSPTAIVQPIPGGLKNIESRSGGAYRPLPRIAVLLGPLVAAPLLASGLKPTLRAAEVSAPVQFEAQIPEAFGGWTWDPATLPVMPDRHVQAFVNRAYSQTLARTYVNARGERVMLSLAYNSIEDLQMSYLHRPEACYSAQGFAVRTLGQGEVRYGTSRVPVRRLVATMGPRHEPISYWVVMVDQARYLGLGWYIDRLVYGLRGWIPDGVLVRVSSIDASVDRAQQLQDDFLTELQAVLPAAVRSRYFGSAGS